MQVQTIASSTLPSVNLSPAELQGLGLNESDIPQIQDVALRIQGNNPLSVAEFGREIADHTSSYADGLLDQVRNSDLDDAGAKLTQVLTVAQGVNVNALLDTRSRIPVLGPLLDRLNLKRRQVLGEFDTTREQIEKLIDEVSLTQTGLSERNVGLEEMYHAVREEYRLLGVHIAAGKQRLGELIRESNSLRDEASNDPTRVQQLSDLDNLISNLDKRIGDLTALQQSALQTLPTIRLLQNNNQQLIDKFATIRTVAIPAWKRG
ncbi:TPA: toxic anion resistance protein, partial [Pseudomonas aeruginosa]